MVRGEEPPGGGAPLPRVRDTASADELGALHLHCACASTTADKARSPSQRPALRRSRQCNLASQPCDALPRACARERAAPLSVLTAAAAQYQRRTCAVCDARDRPRAARRSTAWRGAGCGT